VRHALENWPVTADHPDMNAGSLARRLGDWLGIEPDGDDGDEFVRLQRAAADQRPDAPRSAAYEAELVKLREAIQELQGGLAT
jgi:hypothetical protein